MLPVAMRSFGGPPAGQPFLHFKEGQVIACVMALPDFHAPGFSPQMVLKKAVAGQLVVKVVIAAFCFSIYRQDMSVIAHGCY